MVTVPVRFCYCFQLSGEDNVSSGVSLSKGLGEGPHVTNTWTFSNMFIWDPLFHPVCPLVQTCSNLFNLDLTVQGPLSPDMFKLVQPGPHSTGPPFPRHVQTCSLCSPDCWQAGSRHSTEMPSCCNIALHTVLHYASSKNIVK